MACSRGPPTSGHPGPPIRWLFRARDRDRGGIATILDEEPLHAHGGAQIKKIEDLKGGSIGVTVVGSRPWCSRACLAKRRWLGPEKGHQDRRGGASARRPPSGAGKRRPASSGTRARCWKPRRRAHLMRLDEVTPSGSALIRYPTTIAEGQEGHAAATLAANLAGAQVLAARQCGTNRSGSRPRASGWREAARAAAYDCQAAPLVTGAWTRGDEGHAGHPASSWACSKQRHRSTALTRPEFVPVKI